MALLICPLVANAHPYEQGQVRLGASGGGGFGGWSAGISAGYFISDGLELGAGSTYIKSDDITLLQLTGTTTYVLLPEAQFNPYIGALLRHWMVLDGDAESQSSVGVRAGLYHLSGGGFMLGFGAVHEYIIDCDSDDSCSSTYPEFSVAVAF